MDKESLAKREDLPFEAAMALTEEFRKTHPDKELVFAGDKHPDEIDAKLKEKAELFEKACHESMISGTCWGCHQLMPGFPAIMDAEEPELPKGWGWIELGEHLVAWECPDCNGPNIPGLGVIGVVVNEDGSTQSKVLVEAEEDEASSPGAEPLPPADAAV